VISGSLRSAIVARLHPASYPGVIAVSAADTDGRLLTEASRVKRVDFVGPGIATVPDPSGQATIVRGTSFAAPIISRQIADYVRAPNPGSARQAIARLSQSALRPRSDRKWSGYGLIGVVATEAAARRAARRMVDAGTTINLRSTVKCSGRNPSARRSMSGSETSRRL